MKPIADAQEWGTGSGRDDRCKIRMEVLPKRFEKYGLTIHPEKTWLISFYPPQRQGLLGGIA